MPSSTGRLTATLRAFILALAIAPGCTTQTVPHSALRHGSWSDVLVVLRDGTEAYLDDAHADGILLEGTLTSCDGRSCKDLEVDRPPQRISLSDVREIRALKPDWGAMSVLAGIVVAAVALGVALAQGHVWGGGGSILGPGGLR